MKKPVAAVKSKSVNASAAKSASAAKKPAAKPSPTAAKAKPAAVKEKPVAPTKKLPTTPPTAAKKKKSTVAAKPASAPKEKIKKPKLIRDSFTMPEVEYDVLDRVKKECLKAGVEIKKSQLLRIGVALIGKMDLASLKGILNTLPPLKTGRPKKS